LNLCLEVNLFFWKTIQWAGLKKPRSRRFPDSKKNRTGKPQKPVGYPRSPVLLCLFHRFTGRFYYRAGLVRPVTAVTGRFLTVNLTLTVGETPQFLETNFRYHFKSSLKIGHSLIRLSASKPKCHFCLTQRVYHWCYFVYDYWHLPSGTGVSS
jgi:hypothetical protein